MPRKHTSGKSITIKLDRMLGLALRQYTKDTNLPPAEVIYRALLYYWMAQNTSAAAHAVNTADLKTDEAWAAFLATDEEANP
jgi:hypothetical protein